YQSSDIVLVEQEHCQGLVAIVL
ncbi:hypothetical protein Tco_0677222, partial [Tanacetum coccineum]